MPLRGGPGGGGGGGALPDPITTQLNVEPPATADPSVEVAPTGDGSAMNAVLRIDGPADLHEGAGDGYFLNIVDADGTEILNVDPSGTLQLKPNTTEGTSGPSYIYMGNPAGAEATELRSGGHNFKRINVVEGSKAVFFVGPGGETVIGATSAPADNTLVAGQMAIWFDDTDGAAKLMVKAKTADGTVATGSVALA